MKQLMIVMVVVLAGLLASCVGTSPDNQDKHATIYITMKVIEETSLTADDVLNMVDTARAGSGTDVSLEGLRQELLNELGLEGLSPADQYLAGLLVDSILGVPEGSVEPGELPEELLRRLDWVEQAALMSGGGE